MKWSENIAPYITILANAAANIAAKAGVYRLFLDSTSGKLSVMAPDGTVAEAATKGDKGDAGDASEVAGPPGESAYQLAVDNGFQGTVQQWLASLKGEPGSAGIAEAPEDGQLYARSNGQWVVVTSQSGGGGTPSGPAKLTGTPISSSTYGSYMGNIHPNTSAFDGDTTTFFMSAGAVNEWVGLDLGAGVTKTLTKVRVYPTPQQSDGGGGNSWSATLTIETSTDNQTWTSLGTTGQTTPDTWQETFINGAITASRYFRVRNAHDICSVAELEFYGS